MQGRYCIHRDYCPAESSNGGASNAAKYDDRSRKVSSGVKQKLAAGKKSGRKKAEKGTKPSLSLPTMLRLALFIIAAAFLTLVYYNHERISLATTVSTISYQYTDWRLNLDTSFDQLVATFVEFPRSNVNVISIPSNPADFTPSTNDTIVPAIIHQVLLGDLEMRPKWEQARSSCLELHPTWDFKLWRSHESNQFVQEYYPQIYSTYRYYPLEIQRSNVLRYLLLDHYGGMYLDLDMRCRQNLEFLRGEEFLTPPANPTGINNAFIVSKKGHPFWTHVVDHLIQYDIDWYTPYLTNMFSTGEFKSREIVNSCIDLTLCLLLFQDATFYQLCIVLILIKFTSRFSIHHTS